MNTRCYNKNFKRFCDYGGRGISVSRSWRKFENFRDDMLVGYDDTKSIDRINNDGNYEVGNCKWSTRQEQNSNKRMQKLTREAIQIIRRRYQNGMYGIGRVLAREYGVTAAVISEVINKKRNYANY